MKMRVCRDEDGACCTARLIAGDLTGGIKISVISFQLGGELKSTIWCNCLHAWTGSSASTVAFPPSDTGLLKYIYIYIFRDGESEPPASPSSEHVMLMCIIMLPCGPGSGKTLPYVACACFPFKICDWMSWSRSQVRATMVPDHVWNSTVDFFHFHAVFLFVDLPKWLLSSTCVTA